MKITMDWGNGRVEVIEDVMDYAIFSKEDLISAVNDRLEDENAWDKLDNDIKEQLFAIVKKNIGYYESLPDMEGFYSEVDFALKELKVDF